MLHHEDMIHIPDGDFWIDRYPVTNAQYRQFLESVPAPTGKWFEADHRFTAENYRNHPATKSPGPVPPPSPAGETPAFPP